ncbi:hypothetical protein HNQ51_000114 [Inhella inkyongensis]|uniref:Uncharacterized protein n=1 Tax=Inhella inkyongensis TaxID=392593 RepID=A0A840S2B2_9BURK|nr:hypothetical protein [Inhella inkyongensis]MBB5202821.1 hypothetical protein [Inhella inkyongensis]
MDDQKTKPPGNARPRLSREDAERLAEEVLAGERFARSGTLLQSLVGASYQEFDLEIEVRPSHTSASGVTVMRQGLRVRR